MYGERTETEGKSKSHLHSSFFLEAGEKKEKQGEQRDDRSIYYLYIFHKTEKNLIPEQGCCSSRKTSN